MHAAYISRVCMCVCVCVCSIVCLSVLQCVGVPSRSHAHALSRYLDLSPTDPTQHKKKQGANDLREARPAHIPGQHSGAGGAEVGGGGVGQKPSAIDGAVIRERLRALAQQAENDGGVQAGAAGGLRKLLDKSEVVPGFDTRDVETEAMVHEAMIQDVDDMSVRREGGGAAGRTAVQERAAALVRLFSGWGGCGFRVGHIHNMAKEAYNMANEAYNMSKEAYKKASCDDISVGWYGAMCVCVCVRARGCVSVCLCSIKACALLRW